MSLFLLLSRRYALFSFSNNIVVLFAESCLHQVSVWRLVHLFSFCTNAKLKQNVCFSFEDTFTGFSCDYWIIVGFYFLGPQEHLVKTRFGEVSVTVFGDKEKPALITYPDVALNCKFTVRNSWPIFFAFIRLMRATWPSMKYH